MTTRRASSSPNITSSRRRPGSSSASTTAPSTARACRARRSRPPADTVGLLYDEICETGVDRIRRASLGVSTTLRPFTFDERSEWRQRGGALIVAEPRAGGPAAEAGLRRGDVVVALDGEVV